MRRLALTLLLTACATTGSGLGQPQRVEAVTITPLALLEDSRCPAEVQCIQAGTVRIRVRLAGKSPSIETEMELGEPILLDDSLYALTGACPTRRADKRIAPRAYRFAFESHRLTAAMWRPEIAPC